MSGGATDGPAHEAAAALLRALSHPHRVAIVSALGHGERCVHELVDALGISQPLVSQHLRVLRGARVVTGRRRSREVAYSLTDTHVAHIVGDAITHAREQDRECPPTPSTTTTPTSTATIAATRP